MSTKLHDLLARFRGVEYTPVRTDVNTEAEGFVYDASDSVREKHGKRGLRSYLEPVLRLFLVLAVMVCAYVYGIYSSKPNERSGGGFVPTIPLNTDAEVFAEDHSWIGPGKESDILWSKEYQIMSDYKFIKIDEPEKYGIPPGQKDPYGVNFYSISVYHQLHCLGLFRALIYDEFLSQNDGNHKRSIHRNKTQEDWYHLGHCFSYIRQAIRCTVDTTLEFPPQNHTGKEHMAAKTGNRQCRDIAFLDDFVEKNKWDQFQ